MRFIAYCILLGPLGYAAVRRTPLYRSASLQQYRNWVLLTPPQHTNPKDPNCLSDAAARPPTGAPRAPQRCWHTYLAKYNDAFARVPESNKLRTTTKCQSSLRVPPVPPIVTLRPSSSRSRLTKKVVYGRIRGQEVYAVVQKKHTFFVNDAKCGTLSRMA